MQEEIEKLLESYKRMCKTIADDKYKVILTEKTRKVSYKGNVYIVSKGDYCYNCSDLMLAKILYMNDVMDKAYRKNIVSLEQVKNIIEEESK